MASIFGTFRRTKKKQGNIVIQQEKTLSGSATLPHHNPTFSSTPNLLKIDTSNQERESQKVKVIPVVNMSENSHSQNTTNGGIPIPIPGSTRRPSSASLKKSTVGSSSSIRSFMSMMNVMGSLKRSKSIRKLGWGSTMNVATSSVPTSSTPFSTTNIYYSSKRDSSKKKSKSEEFLDKEEGDLDEVSIMFQRENRGRNTNMEPGVNSSSGESCSENSSIQESTSSIVRSSRSSSYYNYNNEDPGDPTLTMEKDPVELERKKNILMGTKKFNMDPKKGIEFLVEKGILENTPEDVARFLKDGYGLSKASIGNYLGERINFNEDVLKSFVSLHDFKDLILVQALRDFLWGFRLPGESQKISRMLDAFAERYCQNNPDLFSADTCSVLCYSIIMLNTELHNPNVKDKVTLEQFIKRNRGIEGGELFSSQFMVSTYNSILYEPFRFPEEDGNDLMLTFFNPDYEGWLYKLGGRPRSWKRLWFILSNNCLYFFKFTTDKTPKGIIPLENVLVKTSPMGNKQLHVLTLYKESPNPGIITVDPIKTCKTLGNGATIPKLYNVIQLGTPDRKERDRWVQAINANHSMSRFYSDLTLKKMKKEREGRRGSGTSASVAVRKSQISLPSTAVLPPEVVQDPKKDPTNFFHMKNLSSIDLSKSESEGIMEVQEKGSRVRSRSESRLYRKKKADIRPARSFSKSPTALRKQPQATPEVEILSPQSQNHAEVNINDNNDNNTLSASINSDNNNPEEEVMKTQVSPFIPTSQFSPVSIRRTPNTAAIYDKYKKLSMINELCRANSTSSEPEEPINNNMSMIPELCETRKPVNNNNTRYSNKSDDSYADDPNRTSISSSTSGSGGSDTEDTEFEYQVLKEKESFDAESIQIIDCSTANIIHQTIQPLLNQNLSDNEDDDEGGTSPCASCREGKKESIYSYESNV